MLLKNSILKLLIICLCLTSIIYAQTKSQKVKSIAKDDVDTVESKVVSEDVWALIKQGGEYFDKQEFNKSIPYFRRSIPLLSKLYGKSSEPVQQMELNIAYALNNHGLLLYNQGKYLEAEPFYREALQEHRKISKNKNSADLAICLNNLALLLVDEDIYGESESLYVEALEIYRHIYKDKDDLNLALLLNNLGLLYYNQIRYSEAEVLYNESLTMYNRIYKEKNNLEYATSINNLALLFHKQARYSESESLFQEAIRIHQSIHKNHDNSITATCINNYALLLQEVGRYTEAYSLLIKSLEMRRRIYKNIDHRDLADGINNLAFFLNKQGRYKESEKLYRESLAIYLRIYKNQDHPNLATCINNIALLLYDQEKYSESETFFKKSLEMKRRIFQNYDHPALVFCINNLALLLQNQGRYSEAEALYNESLKISRRIYKGREHPDFATLINNVALFFNMQKRYNETVPLFFEAIDIYKRILKNNFSYFTEKEKEAFLATFKFNFERFTSFAIEHYKDNEKMLGVMFNNQLLLKGIVGISTAKFKKILLECTDTNLINSYAKWNEKKKYIATMINIEPKVLESRGIDLSKLDKEANDLEKELSASSKDFAEYNKEIDFTWRDIKLKLKKDEVAIEIMRFKVFTKNRWTDTIYYAALLVTKETENNPELVLLENGNELEGELFKDYQDYITTSQYQEKWEGISGDGKLYDAFWGKIAEKIKGKTRVYLSFDGVYNQINLNSLYNPKTKKHIIDEIEIVLLTNTRDLAMKKEERKYDNTAELFGFPNYDLGVNEQKELAQDYDLKRKRLLEGARLTELPGTKIEIEESGRILQNNKWTVNEYLGDNALEENLKKINSPRLLHIATHGVFLEEEQIEREKKFSFGMMGDQQKIYYDNPLLRSALFLSGANRSRKGINVEGVEDGVFTGYEAQNLNLMNTELVILSACETGLGVIKSGEGVYGLQRAFRVAGAENIIMSLWKVSDEATKDLILSFYAKWTGGKSVKEAFREAQRELREKYPGAYYWAAFVLIGG